MWTLGIDVAKRRHNATLLDEEGKTVFRNVTFAHLSLIHISEPTRPY